MSKQAAKRATAWRQCFSSQRGIETVEWIAIAAVILALLAGMLTMATPMGHGVATSAYDKMGQWVGLWGGEGTRVGGEKPSDAYELPGHQKLRDTLDNLVRSIRDRLQEIWDRLRGRHLDSTEQQIQDEIDKGNRERAIELAIDSGDHERAIELAIDLYNINTDAVNGTPSYDPNLNPGEGGATSPNRKVRIGDDAFSSPALLASVIGHEAVHCRQAQEGRWYTGPQGWAMNEVEAYDWQLAHADEYGLSNDEIAMVRRVRQRYYDQLTSENKQRVDNGDYTLPPDQENT